MPEAPLRASTIETLNMFIPLATAVLLGLATPLAHADDSNPPDGLLRPNAEEAADVIAALTGLEQMRAEMTVTLGTCVPALEAQHPGQIACTFALKVGAGSSESQADFYKIDDTWQAQPSVSQDLLPFPDPAL